MDYLAIINRIMQEHKIVTDRLKTVGESLSDKEALMAIDKARDNLSGAFKSGTAEKREKLEKALLALQAGLIKHYAFEEEALPPLLGTMLMEALALEHKKLTAELAQAMSVIHDVNLEGLSPEEMLNEEVIMQGLVNRIRRSKEDHLTKEEGILTMLQTVINQKSNLSG